jgi:hypothetical protein
VALILVAAVAVTSAIHPRGFFEAGTLHERLLMVQCYMAVTAVSMLTLAAAISERRLAIGKPRGRPPRWGRRRRCRR